MTIVCAFDGRYLPFAGVALFSLATHMHSPHSVKLHLFYSSISQRSLSEANDYFQHLGFTVEWHDVLATAITKKAQFRSYTSRSPHYHRLLMPYLLPTNTSKVIYLDVDLIVLCDIQDLWRTNLDGRVVAGCRDYLDNFGVAVANYADLGILAEDKYFNSGVMVVDLHAWRAGAVSRRVMECTERNSDYLDALGKFHQYDQYGINVVLNRRWLELDPLWNYGSEKPYRPAAIVHFNGHGKPWSRSCTPEFRDIFYDQLERSGWLGAFNTEFGVNFVRTQRPQQ